MAQYALQDCDIALAVLEQALAYARKNPADLADHRQLGELLNNTACLCHQKGDAKRAMLLMKESLKTQKFVADHSLYVGSKFSCQSSALNVSITKANIAFLHLVMANQDTNTCIALFEEAVRDQQLLFHGAENTLTSTMEHLATAQLLSGNKTKALHVLKRIYHMQLDTFGPSSDRVRSTKHKIAMLQTADDDGRL
jgi:tetratricopeptide (TPR) repeat protein